MESIYDELFELMSREHGLTLTQTEMQDIVQVAVKAEKKTEQGEIYVVVAENDQKHIFAGKEWRDDKGPIVFEQYVNDASIESVKRKIATLRGRYGKCRIARLEYVDE